MIGQPQVYEALERMGISFEYYEHPEAPTIEIAAQFYRGEGTTLCKNLFSATTRATGTTLSSWTVAIPWTSTTWSTVCTKENSPLPVLKE